MVSVNVRFLFMAVLMSVEASMQGDVKVAQVWSF